MTTPRLSDATVSSAGALTPELDICDAEEKIAKSESLSALFSYFKNWSALDESLKFKGDSILKVERAA